MSARDTQCPFCNEMVPTEVLRGHTNRYHGENPLATTNTDREALASEIVEAVLGPMGRTQLPGVLRRGIERRLADRDARIAKEAVQKFLEERDTPKMQIEFVGEAKFITDAIAREARVAALREAVGVARSEGEPFTARHIEALIEKEGVL